jgi:hypothetical protein
MGPPTAKDGAQPQTPSSARKRTARPDEDKEDKEDGDDGHAKHKRKLAFKGYPGIRNHFHVVSPEDKVGPDSGGDNSPPSTKHCGYGGCSATEVSTCASCVALHCGAHQEYHRHVGVDNRAVWLTSPRVRNENICVDEGFLGGDNR